MEERQREIDAVERAISSGSSLEAYSIGGLPPILHYASLCDEDNAVRLLAAAAAGVSGVDPDAVLIPSRFTALHVAAQFHMPDLARALVRAGASVRLRSEDIVQPFGPPVSGGRTALHVAAEADDGSCAIVKLLLAAGASPCQRDFDGNTPAVLAAMAGRTASASLLRETEAAAEAGAGEAPTTERPCTCGAYTQPNPAAVPTAEWLAAKRLSDARAASARLRQGLNPCGSLRTVHLLRAIWTEAQCNRLVSTIKRAAGARGWDTNRHAAYATTDLRCNVATLGPELHAWVVESLRDRVLVRMSQVYGADLALQLPVQDGHIENVGSRKLEFRELFFAYYRASTGFAGDDGGDNGGDNDSGALTAVDHVAARGEDGDGKDKDKVGFVVRDRAQASLPLHRDGSLLSFNILLNNAAAFDGGGTYFELLDTTYRGQQGDAVIHSGRLRHAGAEVTRGERYVLVGFVDVVDGSS